jgi:hypothetical protein
MKEDTMRQTNSTTATDTRPSFDDTMRMLLTRAEAPARPAATETPRPAAQDHTEEDGTDWCALWAHYSEMMD